MKYFFLFLFLTSCSSLTKSGNETILELGLTPQKGYGPFAVSYSRFSWEMNDQNSTWGKTQVEVKGIPKDWENYTLQQIWFDAKQFGYQNHHQGNIDSTFYKVLENSWDINLKKRALSKRPIKCFSHILMKKSKSGKISYIVDINNNRDFSDDIIITDVETLSWKDKKKGLKNTHSMVYETFENGKIIEKESELLILESGGKLLYNFPGYYTSSYKNEQIDISFGFSDFTFDNPKLKKSSEGYPILMNEYITLNNNTFKNLGVNFNKHLLKLERMEYDSNLVSSQVGYFAKPFNGNDFLSNEVIKFSNYNGKFLYLDFWGTWCSPCVREIPNLKKAVEQLDSNKINFLGIAEDSEKSLKKFLDKNKLPWKQILNSQENNIVKSFGVKGFPTTYLIDPDGKIVAKNLRGKALSDTLNHFIKNYFEIN